MSLPRNLPEPPCGRSKQQSRADPGVWNHEMKKLRKLKEKLETKKVMREDELSAFPQYLFEEHNCWTACVTYVSPVVKRLIERSKARELECTKTFEESQGTPRPNKTCSIAQQKRRKLAKPSSNCLKDGKSESMLSVWDAISRPSIIPESVYVHTEARDSPTANYNKIIFSRRPAMRRLPYSSLLASKEKQSDV